MHRAMEITVPPATRESLIEKLEGVDGLIGLSVQRGPSIVPPGDVLTVHALNRDADRIMRLAAAVQDGGQTSVATYELSSIVDPDKERAVANDLDEALWEESETTLRHQGRVTANYLTLMALGGAVATTGFIVGSPSQAISVVAASVISPGFEPLAKVPMGLALRRWGVVGRGLWSAGVGCLALAFAALRATGVGTVDEFMGNSEIKLLENPLLREVLVSACGAVAGMTMVLLYRRYVITGALMALAVIPAAAMVGAALAAGKLALAYQGAERFFLDVLLIIAGGANVVLLKQTIVHRRAPMA
jgi:hypothetical protein